VAVRSQKRSTSSRTKQRKPSVKKLEEAAAKGKPLPGPLTGSQKRQLRALAHHLEPVIMVGQKGVTDSLVSETKHALEAHELIKVRVGKNAPEETEEAAKALAEKTKSELVQVIGAVVVLYRAAEDPEKRKIRLGAK
jgi:RNA-binding protein